MTQDYYGTKRITAWEQDKNGAAGYAVKYSDGYISWSPRQTFEEAYQPLYALSFGHAIVAMKGGQRVARRGWNCKGMFIFLEKGTFDGPSRGFSIGEEIARNHPSTQDGIGFGFFECQPPGASVRLPRFCMKSASGAIVVGWLASQTDMLSEDWQIVE